MKSLVQQTNSLVNVGDIIIIKTPLPINPNDITILGYEVITQDIFDFRDWVGGYYAISPVSTDSQNTINNLTWEILTKDEEGENLSFCNNCNTQTESFYIYFKFEKLVSSGQIINITKVNLKIQDSSSLEELKQKYPYYYQSLFNGFSPNDSNVLTWQYNVLDKVSGDSILPHYIQKDKDFSIFWGWVTHFFALIVHFGRKFKDIFSNYLEYLDDVGEFMREKDYIRDSRVQIDKDLKIALSEELIYSPICGQRISTSTGYPSNSANYIFSSYLLVHQGNIIILKVGGYNQDSDVYNGASVNVDIAYYYKNYSVASHSTITLTATEAKNGKRILVPTSSGEQIMYVAISYPRLGTPSLPLYVRIFVEGEGIYSIENRTEQDIFGIYKDFRKRGTVKSNSLVKKVLEVKKEDGFHADYLNQHNVGWFLNRNSPVSINHLNDYVLIDSLVPKTNSLSSSVTTIGFLDQLLVFNQNTSLILKWKAGATPSKVHIKISTYDKEGNELLDTPILGNWEYDSTIKGYKDNFENLAADDAIEVTPKYNSALGYYYIEVPINIVENQIQGDHFLSNDYDERFFLNKDNYIFTRYNNDGTHEVYYIKIEWISIICSTSSSALLNNDLINFEIGLYLRKSSFNLGFLNNKQYFLCNFKNNGVYTDEDAKELISQKVLPYNGFRLWINNSLWYNEIILPLELDFAYFDKDLNRIHIKIKGGIAPYTYSFYLYSANNPGGHSGGGSGGGQSGVGDFNNDFNSDFYIGVEEDSSEGNRSLNILGEGNRSSEPQSTTTYEQEVYWDITEYGIYVIRIVDSIGQVLYFEVSCQTYNEVNYKMQVLLSIGQEISTQVYLYGGTEKSYELIWYRDEIRCDSLILPAKNWMSLDKLEYVNIDYYYALKYLNTDDVFYVVDNGRNRLNKGTLSEAGEYYNQYGIDQRSGVKNIQLSVVPGQFYKVKSNFANCWVVTNSSYVVQDYSKNDVKEDYIIIPANGTKLIINVKIPASGTMEDALKLAFVGLVECKIEMKTLFENIGIDFYDNGEVEISSELNESEVNHIDESYGGSGSSSGTYENSGNGSSNNSGSSSGSGNSSSGSGSGSSGSGSGSSGSGSGSSGSGSSGSGSSGSGSSGSGSSGSGSGSSGSGSGSSGEEETWGDYYKLDFYSGINSQTPLTERTKASTVLREGTEYVINLPFVVEYGKVYYGDSHNIIQLGKNGNAARLIINLSEEGKVYADQIIVLCKRSSGDDNRYGQLTVNGVGPLDPVDYDSSDPYVVFYQPTNLVFNISPNEILESIVLESTAKIMIYDIKVVKHTNE